MSADRDVVIKVLAGQSPDYFIFPNASAFVAEELDPRDVAATLEELQVEGVVEREMFEVPGDAANDGGVEHVPGGYRLVATPKPAKKGRKR